MAMRTLNRRALRDAAERLDPEAAGGGGSQEPPAEKKPRVRKAVPAKPVGASAPPKPPVRRKSVKVPVRMFARWAVCDNGLKRVAVFEYKDRAGADSKLGELLARKTGYVLILVKDPYDPLVGAGAPAPTTNAADRGANGCAGGAETRPGHGVTR